MERFGRATSGTKLRAQLLMKFGSDGEEVGPAGRAGAVAENKKGRPVRGALKLSGLRGG